MKDPDDQPRKEEPSPERKGVHGRESVPQGAPEGAPDGNAESLPGPEHDIGPVLQAWKHGRRHATVRLVRAQDGRRVLQVRLELGLLQMELEGRPDGRRPHGAESLLAWHQARLEAHRAGGNDDDDFRLTSKECDALRAEGVQVYHRYAALFVLEEFELVVRDTERNLRLFDFCARHGHSRQDRTGLEQYRPFVLMMHARAKAAMALAAGDDRSALGAIDAALAALRAHFDEHGPEDGFERSNEATLLRGMRAVLVPRLPTSQRAELEERLRRAVAAENFELAAILRDELRSLEG